MVSLRVGKHIRVKIDIQYLVKLISHEKRYSACKSLIEKWKSGFDLSYLFLVGDKATIDY